MGIAPAQTNSMAEPMRTSWLIDLLADMRFGSRMLRRSPGFALAAILTIALGIGANTAMFSVADGLLLRPAPFEHPERLYWIYDVNAKLRLTSADTVPNSPANFLDWRREQHSFDYVVAWRNWFYSVAGASNHPIAAEQVRALQYLRGFLKCSVSRRQSDGHFDRLKKNQVVTTLSC